MKRRSGIKIMAQLIVLMKPLALYMIIAIFLGVLGFLCATGVPVTGAMGMLVLFGFPSPVSLRVLICILFTCAILRGILRYGEQASNHYIAVSPSGCSEGYGILCFAKTLSRKIGRKRQGQPHRPNHK